MRTWLYNRVQDLLGIPASFGAANSRRVISSGAADTPAFPFIVIQMGVEQNIPGMPAETKVQTIPFTVWLHDEPGSMLLIDEAATALKDNLPVPAGAVVGSMSVYEVRWVETGQDAYDDHWRSNCRPVRFVMTTRKS